MDNQSIIQEIEYGYFIDQLWAKVKTIKDDREFAKAFVELEASHPEIHNRACYDKQKQFVERMFMKQVRDV